METIKASEFKAKCLTLMDEVARTGVPIQVTKYGKPVAELRPCSGARVKSPFGLHKSLIKISGDIMAPVAIEWEAQS